MVFPAGSGSQFHAHPFSRDPIEEHDDSREGQEVVRHLGTEIVVGPKVRDGSQDEDGKQEGIVSFQREQLIVGNATKKSKIPIISGSGAQG